MYGLMAFFPFHFVLNRPNEVWPPSIFFIYIYILFIKEIIGSKRIFAITRTGVKNLDCLGGERGKAIFEAITETHPLTPLWGFVLCCFFLI